MGKYEKRRYFRAHRRAGVPFLVACALSRRGWDVTGATLPEGYSGESVTRCECCGPEFFRVTETKTGRSWEFSYFTGMPAY